MSNDIHAVSLHDDASLRSFFYDQFRVYYTHYRNDVDDDGFPVAEQQNNQCNLPELLTVFHRIAYIVEKGGFFSPNEELDDVQTTDLLFILVPFILAELYANGLNVDNRLQNLTNALVYWKQFLASCESLGLCGTEQKGLWRRDTAPSAASKRQEKIQRYRRKQELNKKILSLVAKKQKVADPFEWGAPSLDEELERELSIALIQRSIDDTFDHQEGAALEIEMLRSSCSTSTAFDQPAKKSNERLDKKPFLLKINNPLQLRELYRDKVFQPYHELPTVSLADVAAWEMDMEVNQIGAAARAKQKERDAKRTAEKEGYAVSSVDGTDSDDESCHEDEKEDKARRWDDWKDENPRGSGNKNRNVGAPAVIADALTEPEPPFR